VLQGSTAARQALVGTSKQGSGGKGSGGEAGVESDLEFAQGMAQILAAAAASRAGPRAKKIL
jgi:hypothetical protein